MRAFVWYVRVFVVVLLLLSSVQTIVAADHQAQHRIGNAMLAQQPAITSSQLLIALVYGLSLLSLGAGIFTVPARRPCNPIGLSCRLLCLRHWLPG